MDSARYAERAGGGKYQNVSAVRHVAVVGLIVNVVLSAAKFVGGILGSSQAVVADAVHSISDIGTDLVILVGSRYWSAPPDKDHPHGHGRIEILVSSIIGLSLASVAGGLMYNAVTTIEADHSPPTYVALVAALLSIVSKEILYRWTVSEGHRIKSQATIANAWHHRSDGMSSVPAALAVGAAMIKPEWVFLDHIGAVLVSLFILYAAWDIVRPSLDQLIDVAAPEEEVEKIRVLALETEGVETLHAVRTRYIGNGLQVDLHIQVDGGMTVYEGHDISKDLKARLISSGPDVVDVVVHLEPCIDKAD